MHARAFYRKLSNLLPVGKGLVIEESGSDGGIAQASDSDRTAKFRTEKASSGSVPLKCVIHWPLIMWQRRNVTDWSIVKPSNDRVSMVKYIVSNVDLSFFLACSNVMYKWNLGPNDFSYFCQSGCIRAQNSPAPARVCAASVHGNMISY